MRTDRWSAARVGTTSGAAVNRARAAWRRGEPTVGGWYGQLTQLEAERVGGLGYDWVLLDMESSGLHWDAMIGLIQALELGGSRAMVRVPSADPVQIMRALDYGAIGVVVPMVNTVEDAVAVGSCTRYPPLGTRGNGRARHGDTPRADADADVVCVVMIESGEGLANADAIAAVPGIDALMIGQVDLALSLGWPLPGPGGFDIATHPQALEALRHVTDVARRHGKRAAAASVGGRDEDLRALLELGVEWLGYRPSDGTGAEDLTALVDGWKRDFRAPGLSREA